MSAVDVRLQRYSAVQVPARKRRQVGFHRGCGFAKGARRADREVTKLEGCAYARGDYNV